MSNKETFVIEDLTYDNRDENKFFMHGKRKSSFDDAIPIPL